MTGIKMAKASEKDLAAALDIAGILEDIDKGYFPRDPSKDGDAETNDPTFFDEDDPQHLVEFFKRLKWCLDAAPGGVFRVAFGMTVLLDPRNELVDPDLDHLAMHPRLIKAVEASQQQAVQS